MRSRPLLPTYSCWWLDLLAETPFLLGATLPIIFDVSMLFAISSWQRYWMHLDTPAARLVKEAEARKAEALDLLRTEQEDTVIEQRIRLLVAQAEVELPEIPADAQPKERRKLEARRRRIQILQADLRRNESALHVIEERLRQRKERRAHVKLELSRHLQDLELEKIEVGS